MLHNELLRLNIPYSVVPTANGDVLQTATNVPVRIRWSAHKPYYYLEILSIDPIVPMFGDDVEYLIATINLRSPRYPWRLTDAGHFAVFGWCEPADLLKALKTIRKKFGIFGKYVEEVGSGRVALNDQLLVLVSVRQ